MESPKPKAEELVRAGLWFSRPLPNLDVRSWFEPPIAIYAELAPMNQIQIGAFTGIFGGKVGHAKIGRYCSIARDVDIASDQHPMDWLSSSMVQYVPNVHGWGDWLRVNGHGYEAPTAFFDSNRIVTIGNDVWFGHGVFVKSGVTIGDGAVVAARSVVVSDVPPYSVVAGVPARVKKMRFAEPMIERMQRVAWWQYNVAGIAGLDAKHPERALDRIEELVAAGSLAPYAPIRRSHDGK